MSWTTFALLATLPVPQWQDVTVPAGVSAPVILAAPAFGNRAATSESARYLHVPTALPLVDPAVAAAVEVGAEVGAPLGAGAGLLFDAGLAVVAGGLPVVQAPTNPATAIRTAIDRWVVARA